jgi:hypothetical protein
MGMRRPVRVLLAAFMVAAVLTQVTPRARAQTSPAVDESFFVETVYPLLHAAQCERCHSDNGVASETRLEFPEPGAGSAQIKAFGLSLIDLVDRRNPEQSLLLRKPTKRVKHTGGQRVKPQSDEEKVLLSWINYLAGLSDEAVRQARENITRAERAGPTGPTVRRLTHSQYNNTVRDLLGDQTEPASGFPKEDFINGFKNQVEGQGVSPLQAEAYSKAAERLAFAAFRGGDHHRLISRQPQSATDARWIDPFVREFGLKAFRRPLTDQEVGRYSGLFHTEVSRTKNFHGGGSMVIEAMLQSPHFLFRFEGGNGGPDTRFAIASRLSYFLWNTMPDDDLLRAAGRGELTTMEQIEATARRMVEDPRAKSAMDEFLAQWMRFDRVRDATRDRRRFREFNPEVAAAMMEETRRLFNHLVWSDQNFMEFFTAPYTFVNADLARLYDLPAPDEEFAKVAYPAGSGRAGVLGHGAFLLLTSKPAETSPTGRGLFVRNQFLAQEIPPPPAGVNAVLATVSENAPLTNRQRLAVHLNSESCASCHRMIDPIGLAFEQYNAIGVFQKKMVLQFPGPGDGQTRGRTPMIKELDVDTSGFIQGMEDSEFSTPRELGRLLAESKTCQKAVVKQLFRYAFGRQETASDQPTIDALVERFCNSGFRFRELIVAVVTSELFLQKGSG